MNVYIAAPLFSASEREFNLMLGRLIEGYCHVHLPQRDGPLVAELVARGESMATASQMAFDSDIRSIRDCDVVVAVLDGRAPDEGVCVEIGFAKALAKLLLGYKSDMRTVLPWGNNPMIDGCIDEWVSSPQELQAWIVTRQREGISRSGD